MRFLSTLMKSQCFSKQLGKINEYLEKAQLCMNSFYSSDKVQTYIFMQHYFMKTTIKKVLTSFFLIPPNRLTQ